MLNKLIELKKPVFILDIDETIIGDIKFQLNEYNIINAIYRHQKSIMLEYKKNLIFDLKNGLLRPTFQIFINFCKNNNISVFLYSAGSLEWINFLIPIIEKLISFKFEKPYFTRNNMINALVRIGNVRHQILMKSIKNIKLKIYKILKKKYILPIDIDNRIIMIDNRIDNIINNKYIIKCPSYSYAIVSNPLRVLTDEQKYNLRKDISLLLYGKIYDYNTLLILIYSNYLKNIKLYGIKNNKYYKDKFFNFITLILSKMPLDTITSKNLIYALGINKSLST
jgi:hypothetical protein